MTVLRELADIIGEIAGVDASVVTAEKLFVCDLGVDSLSMVEIALEVEQRLGVEIPDAELSNLKTVGDAVNYVTGHP
jgi:acyl carrier protein